MSSVTVTWVAGDAAGEYQGRDQQGERRQIWVERMLLAVALEASLGATAIPLDKPAGDLVNEECMPTIEKEVELPSFGGSFRSRPVAWRESGGHRLGSVEPSVCRDP